MKFTTFPILLAAILLPMLPGCKKEVTFDDRLSGKWQSTEVIVNSEDKSNTYSYTLELLISKVFTRNLDIVVGGNTITDTATGVWAADETAQTLTLTYSGSIVVENYNIVELSGDTLKLHSDEGGQQIDVTFEKQ